MSLISYADLQTQVANWLARSDLTSYIPDFITLFEASACRRLKVRPMEATASISTTAGVGALPTDYLGYRRMTWTGTPFVELEYVSPPEFTYYNPVSLTAVPRIFTIEASNVKIAPADDTGLEMVYYQRTPAVSGALNWLYTNHPDAYLFGALTEATAFTKDATKAALWKARRDEVFSEIQTLDFNERNGMSIRVMGATP